MAAPRARLDVSQTRVSDSLSRAIFQLMALVTARKHETTKPRKVSFSRFRVFVFSWLIAGGVMAAHAQVRVGSPEGGEGHPVDLPADIKATGFLFPSTHWPISYP